MNPIGAATSFDWITTAICAVKAVAGYRPISVYWSEHPPAHYEKILRKKGIPTEQGGIGDDGFVILVPNGQIARARRILDKEGAALA